MMKFTKPLFKTHQIAHRITVQIYLNLCNCFFNWPAIRDGMHTNNNYVVININSRCLAPAFYILSYADESAHKTDFFFLMDLFYRQKAKLTKVVNHIWLTDDMAFCLYTEVRP